MTLPRFTAFALALLLALLSPGAPAQGLLTHVDSRATTTLDGDWHSIVDPYESGYYDFHRRPYDQQSSPSTAAFYADHRAQDKSELVEYDFDKSPTLRVPGDWNSQQERLLLYEGTVWYRRVFDAPATRVNPRWFLHFGAVAQRAEVYLNGVKLGQHEGGFTPFQFEVTRWLKPHANRLVVKVDNTRRAQGVPTVSTDWWNYGGITREVRLIEEPSVFIEDFGVQLRRDAPHRLAGYVQLNGQGSDRVVSVTIPELGLQQALRTDALGRAQFEVDLPRSTQLWSPEQPKLYEVQASVEAQVLTDRIGLRHLSTRGADILLNGRPIFLRGISIHEENALLGRRAHSEADALQALGWAQELGCNFVRLAHYPHNEAMLRAADRLGLMVWAEIPVYWTIDFRHPATLANARQQLAEVIQRDRHRASVILWSVANETPLSEARNDFLGTLIDDARRLDPSRLVTAAMLTQTEGATSVLSDPIGARLDVVAFNQYRGWYGGSLHDAPQARWEVRYDKPVIVSEFGGGALAGRHGPRDERWTEEYQAYLYEQNLAMIEHIPQVRGLSPWILADFRSPRRLLPGVQDGYNRKGLISNQGVKKQAFYTLQDFYRRVRESGATRLPVSGRVPRP